MVTTAEVKATAVGIRDDRTPPAYWSPRPRRVANSASLSTYPARVAPQCHRPTRDDGQLKMSKVEFVP